jgi:hypothetical protein
MLSADGRVGGVTYCEDAFDDLNHLWLLTVKPCCEWEVWMGGVDGKWRGGEVCIGGV